MKHYRAYTRFTKFVLGFVFLVILAGGIVRTTQSGMGCPDWPKCFGSWIPPTDVSQLPPDYAKYLRQQDIDHSFNPYHTWVEYINRLLGALLGVFVLIHVIWSYRRFYKIRKSVFWYSFSLLLLTGFQGWLGKRVVDANLAVLKITTHMLVALVLAAIPVIILNKLQHQHRVANASLKWLVTAGLACTIIQIVLGTDVRQQVDTISASLNYQQRELWVPQLNEFFFIHQNFSWVVALTGIFIFWFSLPYERLQRAGIFVFVLIIGIMAAGLSLAYLHMPAAAQPIHLLLASILSITLFAMRLRLK